MTQGEWECCREDALRRAPSKNQRTAGRFLGPSRDTESSSCLLPKGPQIHRFATIFEATTNVTPATYETRRLMQCSDRHQRGFTADSTTRLRFWSVPCRQHHAGTGQPRSIAVLSSQVPPEDPWSRLAIDTALRSDTSMSEIPFRARRKLSRLMRPPHSQPRRRAPAFDLGINPAQKPRLHGMPSRCRLRSSLHRCPSIMSAAKPVQLHPPSSAGA